MEGEGVGKDDKVAKYSLPHLSQLLLFWPSLTPLVQISFSPQPSTVVKIKDGCYSSYQVNSEHSPGHSSATITPALQAKVA